MRQAAEVEEMFEKTEEHLDSDRSENETKDAVETESVHESEKYAEEVDEEEGKQVADDQSPNGVAELIYVRKAASNGQ